MKAWVLGLTILFASGAASGSDGKDDSAKLNGTWTTNINAKKYEMKFDKGTFYLGFATDDKKGSVKGTFKVDSSKKPKQIDPTITDVEGFPAEDFKGKTSHAIYDLDGDTFKWCANKPGDDGHPTEFPDKESEGKYLYLVFKRAK
jgi:uncharacterized protein (TIGR03067 family)